MNVVKLDQSQYLALKTLSSRFMRPKLDMAGNAVKLRDIVWYEYRTSAPEFVYYKNQIKNDYNYFKAIRADATDMQCELVPLNSELIPLSQEKLEDLRSLLPFISNNAYYKTLLKNLATPKRGRKKANNVNDHFENDLDDVEED